MEYPVREGDLFFVALQATFLDGSQNEALPLFRYLDHIIFEAKKIDHLK